jgi:4-aminobutyrate aminotransferase-like enzyme
MQKVLISTQPIIKKYLDFVAGVSACTLGHQPARVNQAIKDQLDKYSHVMVYGEYSQSPAVEYCAFSITTPESLDKTYLVNSGTEAISVKLARRVTGRSQLISATMPIMETPWVP